MLNVNITWKPAMSLFCGRIKLSPGYVAYLIVVLLLAGTFSSSAALELCGGVRNRFVCDDEDPTVFHICLGNNQYTMTCPGTLHFNLRTQNCDWPDSVNCVQEALSRQLGGTSSPKLAPSLVSTKSNYLVAKPRDSSTSRLTRPPPISSLPAEPVLNNTHHSFKSSALPVVETTNTETPNSRFRLKAIPGLDKPIESLLPADEKVIEEVKKLSEELKHIDNYLQSLETDQVGFLIEPYMAKFPRRRPSLSNHRYIQAVARNNGEMVSSSPYKKRWISSASPFKKKVSPHPYRAKTTHFYTSRPTHNLSPRTSPKVMSAEPKTSSPYKPTAVLYHSPSTVKQWRITPTPGPRITQTIPKVQLKTNFIKQLNDQKKKPQGPLNNNFNPLAARSSTLLEMNNISPRQSKGRSFSAYSPSWNKNSDKSQTSTRVAAFLDHTRSSTARRQEQTHPTTDSREQSNKHSTTDSREQTNKHSTTDSREHSNKHSTTDSREHSNKHSTTDSREHSNKHSTTDSREQSNKHSTTDSREQSNKHPKADYRVTHSSSQRTQKKVTARTSQPKTSTSNSPSTGTSWWSRDKIGFYPTSSFSQRPPKLTDSPPTRILPITPRKSQTPSALKASTSTAVTARPPTSRWWSSTPSEIKPTSTPNLTRRMNRRKYKPRHHVSKPNYNTRTPNVDFALIQSNQKSSSYKSKLQQRTHPLINAAAALERNPDSKSFIGGPEDRQLSFDLNNHFRRPEDKERNFGLHKSFGVPVARERNFALHNVHSAGSTDRIVLHNPYAHQPSNNEVETKIDKLFTQHKPGEELKTNVISAYRSPIEKYETKKGKCSSSWCKLPDCRCIGSDIPVDMDVKDVPQMVMLTFDDSINSQNMHYFRGLFNGTITNPNGCPIRSTFFVSGDNSDYDMVKRIYKQGHEIASHTLSHRNPTTWWASAGFENWEQEIAGMRERLHVKSGVPLKEITGMRAPFLQVGGDGQFAMLKENKFRYDSSMVTGNLYSNNRPPIWPFTLDTPPDGTTCSLTPCPTRSYPGLWEVPLVRWYGANKIACAMPDACTIDPGIKGSRKFIDENFQRHYATNRAPLGIFIHASWFSRKDGNFQALYEFLASLVNRQDVWVVTMNQVLDWIQHPVPLPAIASLKSWQC